MQQRGIQTVLGFDFGLKRTGVAVGQTVTSTAQAITTLISQTESATQQQHPDWQGIQKIIHQWRPDALIVGLPKTADGRSSPVTTAIYEFCEQLQQRFQLPVIQIEETLSSAEAAERLRNLSTRSKKHKKNQYGERANLDAMAAQVIVETWLASYSAS